MPTVSRLGINHFAGVKNFGGEGRANQFRKEKGAPIIGEQSYVGEILPNTAFSVAMRISAARARFIPAPAAGPFTAAITGCMLRIFKNGCIPERKMGPSCAVPSSRPLPITPRSPPAQNARPAPVKITT